MPYFFVVTKILCQVEIVTPMDHFQKRRRSLFTSNQGSLLLIWVLLISPGPAIASSADDHRTALVSALEVGERVTSLHTLRRKQSLMGTWLEITTQANDKTLAIEASEAAFAAAADAELRLSTWRDDTELAAVNDLGPNAPVEISPLLERDLATALMWNRATYGAFNPGVGSLVTLWNLRGQGRVPTGQEIEGALADSSLVGTEIADGWIRFGQPGLQLEEGGFGKGAALSDAISAATGHGARCVILDFGGQIAVAGHCDSVTIGISDPGDRLRVVGLLSVTEGSVATSGLSERHFVAGDVRYGHIIDPGTGSPAPDWGSVTVLAPDPQAADCISTALFVMGPESAMTWVGHRPDIEAVFSLRTDAGLRIKATSGLIGHLTPMEGLSVEWIPRADPQRRGPPLSAPTGN
jgi:thiamine biosynthesis lipoprotein